MPQHQSAVKRTRQNARRAERNKANISRLKSLVKKVRSSKNKEEARTALSSAIKYLDRLGTRGVIHKNKASNQKSRLTTFVNKLS